MLTRYVTTIGLPAQIDIPDIEVDWSAPFIQPMQVVASWVLTGAIVFVLILLTIAIASIAGKRLAPERMQAWAGENVLWIFGVAVLLGSASGLFQYFVNFDLGF